MVQSLKAELEGAQTAMRESKGSERFVTLEESLASEKRKRVAADARKYEYAVSIQPARELSPLHKHD